MRVERKVVFVLWHCSGNGGQFKRQEKKVIFTELTVNLLYSIQDTDYNLQIRNQNFLLQYIIRDFRVHAM
jgi:hypothetical protein